MIYPELEVLVGSMVGRVILDRQFVEIMVLGGVNREWKSKDIQQKFAIFQIEADFTVTNNGKSYIIDVNKVETIPPLLKVLYKKLESIAVNDNEDLTLLFFDGIRLEVKGSQKLESWHLRDEDLGWYIA